MSNTVTVSITIEELWFHKWGLYETIEILYPGQLSFILDYKKGNHTGAYNTVGGTNNIHVCFVLK